MINMISFDYSQRIGRFAVSVKDELEKLPRIGIPGQDNLNTVKSCAQGSTAKVISGDDAGMYQLDGSTNTWVKMVGAGGGGGGDIDPSDLAQPEDIDKMFADLADIDNIF